MLQRAIGAVSNEIERTERRLSLTPIFAHSPTPTEPESLSLPPTPNVTSIPEPLCVQEKSGSGCTTTISSGGGAKKKGGKWKQITYKGARQNKQSPAMLPNQPPGGRGTDERLQTTSEHPLWASNLLMDLKAHFASTIKIEFDAVMSCIDNLSLLLDKVEAILNITEPTKSPTPELVLHQNQVISTTTNEPLLPAGPNTIVHEHVVPTFTPPASQNRDSVNSQQRPPHCPAITHDSRHISTTLDPLNKHQVNITMTFTIGPLLHTKARETRPALSCIDLPPASTPYVIVLAGAPELETG